MKRWPEWVLLLAGASLLSTGAWSVVRYEAFQSHPQWFIRQTNLPATQAANLAPMSESHRILGRLEIPRLGFSVIVVEGDDETSLDLAAGHLPGTAAFGAEGNAVVAGHRDMTFRPLRNVKRGDTINVRAGTTYKYIVEDVRIVEPEDVRVLRNENNDRTLTLITCYPFHYLGDAPKRYVVRAKMAGV